MYLSLSAVSATGTPLVSIAVYCPYLPAGYRSHQHGGTLDGFHSRVFFLPDMDVGSFYHTNFGGSGAEQSYVYRFMMDVLLGYDPAYNSTQVCDLLTYDAMNDGHSDESSELGLNELKRQLATKETPNNVFLEETLVEIDRLGLGSVLVNDVINVPDTVPLTSAQRSQRLADARRTLVTETSTPSRAIENYFGEYGNFAHGNLTVSTSNQCSDCLYMVYGNLGQYTLYPSNVTDVFFGFNVYPPWSWTPVTFSGEDDTGNALTVVPLIFELLVPPEFERGLMMSEAPTARNDLCVPIL